MRYISYHLLLRLLVDSARGNIGVDDQTILFSHVCCNLLKASLPKQENLKADVSLCADLFVHARCSSFLSGISCILVLHIRPGVYSVLVRIKMRPFVG